MSCSYTSTKRLNVATSSQRWGDSLSCAFYKSLIKIKKFGKGFRSHTLFQCTSQSREQNKEDQKLQSLSIWCNGSKFSCIFLRCHALYKRELMHTIHGRWSWGQPRWIVHADTWERQKRSMLQWRHILLLVNSAQPLANFILLLVFRDVK